MEILSSATFHKRRLVTEVIKSSHGFRGAGRLRAKENNYLKQKSTSSILCVWSRSGVQRRPSPHLPLMPIDHRSDSQRAAMSSRGILGDICGPAGRLGRQPCITAAAGGRDMRPDHQLNKHMGLYEGYSQADGMRGSVQLMCPFIHPDIFFPRKTRPFVFAAVLQSNRKRGVACHLGEPLESGVITSATNPTIS